MSVQAVKITCCACAESREAKATAKGGARLPRGWKRFDERAYCGECWGERFILRAVAFPVVGPIGREWPELRKALAEGWSQSTQLANWFSTELYAADARRESGMAKLPAMPQTYLYPKARERFPEFPAALLVTIEHAVSGKYRAKRYELLWTGETSLPNFRYPFPYPIRSTDWKAKFVDERPVVRCSIARETFELRLRGGAEFRRQLASFRQIVDGQAVQGELSLYRVRAAESDGRNGVAENESGRVTWRIMAKLVAWLPRKEQAKRETERFFSLRTDADCLLYGMLQDRETPWLLNADRVRDWSHQHRRWLQRMGDDSKAETRKPKRRRRRVLAEYDRRAEKYRNRMKSFVQETAAAVAGFCVRNKVTRVKYDDANKSYLAGFPWHELKSRLAVKLDEAGIGFDLASGEEAAKSLEPLAEIVSEEN